MKPISVIVVDDSALIRRMFSDMLSEAPDITVLDTAVDAMDAREKIKRLNPDVITLDIEMPGMDGLSFLGKIMSLRPMPVVMASTLTQKGAGETIRALEIGAVDYVSKPAGDQRNSQEAIKTLQDDLIRKVRMAAQANLKIHTRQAATARKPEIIAFTPPGGISRHIIAIGSSTGGVEALRDIFLTLPANCPPIVITQHMPEHFTTSFAVRLNALSQVRVAEATDGAKLKSGQAWLAPGGARHMKIVRSGADLICRLEEGEPVTGHRPSVDVLFHSVAETAGKHAVGIMLTGMGKDGAAGMLKMRESGAYNIGQNEASCVVYGMPKSAFALGAVHIELPLSEIAAHMLAYCEQNRKLAHG